MGLPWYRMDVGFYRNPKVLELISEAKWRAVTVWQAGIGHCVEHGTDGVIDGSVLPLIHGRLIDARDLLRVGLWVPHPRGWEVWGFAERQQLSDTTKAIRESRSTAGTKGSCKRWHGDQCGCWQKLRAVQ